MELTGVPDEISNAEGVVDCNSFDIQVSSFLQIQSIDMVDMNIFFAILINDGCILYILRRGFMPRL